MSSILKFIRPNFAFDAETLTVLGEVYDRACAHLCGSPSSPACDEMADRIFAAAVRGERNPDNLWQIAVSGIGPRRLEPHFRPPSAQLGIGVPLIVWIIGLAIFALLVATGFYSLML